MLDFALGRIQTSAGPAASATALCSDSKGEPWGSKTYDFIGHSLNQRIDSHSVRYHSKAEKLHQGRFIDRRILTASQDRSVLATRMNDKNKATPPAERREHVRARKPFRTDEAYIEHLRAEQAAGRYTAKVPTIYSLRKWRSEEKRPADRGAGKVLDQERYHVLIIGFKAL